jgi:hypothetical protein
VTFLSLDCSTARHSRTRRMFSPTSSITLRCVCPVALV